MGPESQQILFATQESPWWLEPQAAWVPPKVKFAGIKQGHKRHGRAPSGGGGVGGGRRGLREAGPPRPALTLPRTGFCSNKGSGVPSHSPDS